MIERYKRSHGYTIRPNDPLGIEVVASKPICANGRKKIGDMEIDACSDLQAQPAYSMKMKQSVSHTPFAGEKIIERKQ